MFEVDSWDCGSEKEEKLVHSLFGGREVGKRKNKKNSKNLIKTLSDKKEIVTHTERGSFSIGNNGGEAQRQAARPKKRKLPQLEKSDKIELHHELSKSKKRKEKKKRKNAENNNGKDETVKEITESKVMTEEKKKNINSNNSEYLEQKDEDLTRARKKKKKNRKSNNKFIKSEKIDESFESLKNSGHKQPVDSSASQGDLDSQQDSDLSSNSLEKSTISHKPKEISHSKGCHSKRSELQAKLKQKLESSRFRWINEQLYSIPGDKAFSLFKDDTSLFDVYHQGFRRQVEQWPVNPVDIIIDWAKERSPSLVLADFGCGEAVIAQSVPNKVHSFDLVAVNERVTACNMAKVPLVSCSVDVAIFCLSLMGTDLESFLRETYRVLKPGGILKIAEVVSRMDANTFVPALCQLGFKLDNMDDSNKMFILLDFVKVSQSKKPKQMKNTSNLKLKPCIYKRR